METDTLNSSLASYPISTHLGIVATPAEILTVHDRLDPWTALVSCIVNCLPSQFSKVKLRLAWLEQNNYTDSSLSYALRGESIQPHNHVFSDAAGLGGRAQPR